MSHSDTPSPSATHSSSASHEQSTIPQLGAHPEIEAAVFRRLVQHLQDRSEVQNIDLMNLADFCRNCLTSSDSILSEIELLSISHQFWSRAGLSISILTLASLSRRSSAFRQLVASTVCRSCRD